MESYLQSRFWHSGDGKGWQTIVPGASTDQNSSLGTDAVALARRPTDGCIAHFTTTRKEGVTVKKLLLPIALAVAGLTFLGITEAAAQKHTKKILWAAEDLTWEPATRLPGVMTAKLRGDHSKGAYEEFIKYPAGYKGPPHFHTYNQKIVVIKGVYTHHGKEYGAGSYLLIPAGERHEGGGVSGSETIIYQEQPGRFDLNLDDPPNEKK